MIRFEHVMRRYEPAGRPALDDVTVEFNRGEFVFLIGASGSGKSTLLRMILREGLPQKGRITVAGQNLSLMLERRVPDYRRSVGMVFQDFRLLPDKTVYDNVAFAMRVIGARRSQIRKRVTKVLERVNLDHLAKRYPHEISGGEQQRAAIARAIVNEPAILLADEPTGNLDPRASAEVMKILRWINASGTTVIMATHDRAIVDRMQRRVVQLHRGRLVRDESRGSYDPPRNSEAWRILLEEERESGAWSPTDPKAHGGPERKEEDAAPDLDAPEPAEPEDSERTGEHPGTEEAESAGSPDQTAHRLPRRARRKRKQEREEATQDGARQDGAAEAETTLPDQLDDAEFGPDDMPEPTTSDIRIVWPAARTKTEEDPLPEPSGDFSGAELPDLDRDGYEEAEPTEEPADAVERAAETVTPQSASDPAASQPRMSWLAHAEQEPVNRTGETEEEQDIPDSEEEDRRVADAHTADEPPVAAGGPEPAGEGPRPVPRPKSSASQASYTDTQRTVEQLSAGSTRSFLRRLRRDG